MRQKRQKKAQSHSGAVGGPGTGAGLNYQVDFAVFRALEKISHALVNPLEQGEISMEPRFVTGRAVTCWDVGTSPPDTVTEAKLKPKRDEIVEWLDRVESGLKQSGARQFELFYGRGAGPLISAVERLSRIAKEAGGDCEKFKARVNLERTPDVDNVLNHLMTDPHSSLLRMSVVPFDSAALQRDTQFALRHLVCEPDRQRLYNFLSTKFHKGIEDRVTFKVKDLLEEAKNAGIVFFPPPTFQTDDLDPLVHGTIFILENCEFGLPEDVLTAVLECPIEKLRGSLYPFVEHRVLTPESGLWAVAPLKPRLAHENGSHLLGCTLRQLLEFIKSNRQNPRGWSQVPNAIALAKVCQTDQPELVACLLWRLDKLLKRTGNKRLVLEVADLSIAAAHHGPRTEEQAKGEAVALVCGRSWVYQRINELAKARAEGENSLQLGKEIGWDRNTAYCHKCIGRLFRMEAERQATNAATREDFLRSSIDNLTHAIELFPVLSELPDRDRISETGDCYSLLGRTYLVAGDRTKAQKAAREAIDRITDKSSKDYADLQILLGDIARSENDNAAAASCYEDAIRAAGTADAERSEIAARAWFQKGLLTGASFCFETAAKIWDLLEEDENADKAKWQCMKLAERVPLSATEVLASESPSVRVEVIRLHELALAEMTGPSRGQRAKLDTKYWKALLPDAKRNVAVQHKGW